MSVTEVSLTGIELLDLHKILSAIPGGVAAGDKFCISGVLRRIRQLGDWDADVSVFRLLDCSEIELHQPDGRKQIAADGSVATAYKYSAEALKAPMPPLRVSSEERGAVLRGMAALVGGKDAGCDSVAAIMDAANSLGLLESLETRMYASARPAPLDGAI